MTMEETGSRAREAAEAAVLEQEGEDAAMLAVEGEEAGAIPLSGAARRKRESRRKLMAAARKLFVERGYHETRP